jgi:uncharacterized Zn-finger protein
MAQKDTPPTPGRIATPARPAQRVTAADLPLCCPRPDETLWDRHPRVFLDLQSTGRVQCPYCGAQYELAGPVAAH